MHRTLFGAPLCTVAQSIIQRVSLPLLFSPVSLLLYEPFVNDGSVGDQS